MLMWNTIKFLVERNHLQLLLLSARPRLISVNQNQLYVQVSCTMAYEVYGIVPPLGTSLGQCKFHSPQKPLYNYYL